MTYIFLFVPMMTTSFAPLPMLLPTEIEAVAPVPDPTGCAKDDVSSVTRFRHEHPTKARTQDAITCFIFAVRTSYWIFSVFLPEQNTASTWFLTLACRGSLFSFLPSLLSPRSTVFDFCHDQIAERLPVPVSAGTIQNQKESYLRIKRMQKDDSRKWRLSIRSRGGEAFQRISFRSHPRYPRDP
jgi:hypothetical protein